MFGNSGIASTWGQPQQNQQQQQPGTSPFGQPATSTFGSAAFSTGSAFGQPQQQPPQANPMFGNLGTTPTTTPAFGGGTGAFGTTTNAAAGGIFGAPKPATGFGAFGTGGGSGTFGGTGSGTFGGANTGGAGNGTGMFGNAGTTTSTTGFGGTGTSLFGNKATTFGATPSQGGGTSETVAPMTTGTVNPPYTVYDEKDPSNSGLILHYQSISVMPAYRGSSFEELRFQDYQQGRKTAGAFGQTAFGGAQPQAQSTGLFGQGATNTGATGGAFGPFGNTNTNTTGTTGGFGTFGQTNATQPTGGLFGGGSFSQPQQPQQQQQQQQQQQSGTTGAFGGFGQTQPQQQPATGGGLFGGGAFGNTQNQQKTGFGFGLGTGAGTGGFGTTGTFGPTNQQPASGGLFGAQQQQQQQQQQQNTNFGFGATANNAPKSSIFGNTQPSATGFGFGQTQNQPNQQQGTQPAGGGLFGGGLFGNSQQPQQQQPTGGIFGNTQPAGQQQVGGLFGNAGSGLFGTTSNQQAQPNSQQPVQGGLFSSGLFNPKPATPVAPAGGGLFGGFGQSTTAPAANTQPQGASLFGNLGQSITQQPANTGFGTGGLFGKPTAAAGFGGAQNLSQSGTGALGGGSLFGNLGASTNTAVAQPQGTLTASIAQPIGTNLPIWSMLPPGPRTVPLEQPKKKPAFFVDVPTRSPAPRLQLGYTPAPSKLRGFTSTSNTPPPGSSLTFSAGNPNALSLAKSTTKNLLAPDSFLNGSTNGGLGSGTRQSVKKLTLDKKVEPTDFFRTTTSQSKVNFNPALGVAAREMEAAFTPQRPIAIEPSGTTRGTGGRFTAQSDSGSPKKGAPVELQEGDYFAKPELDSLRRLSYEELCAFDGLVVGRVGFGEVHFLEPVDLTGLSKLGALLGQLIRFDDKECSVYPDNDDVDKPPPGSGLNVKARIILIKCWALDKATREPLKDDKHPLVVRHVKRLKHMKETHFESFDAEEGKWTFTVDHF